MICSELDFVYNVREGPKFMLLLPWYPVVSAPFVEETVNYTALDCLSEMNDPWLSGFICGWSLLLHGQEQTHCLDYCHSVIRLEVGEWVHRLCSFSHWLFCAPYISLWKRNHLSLSVKKPGGSLWGILWSPWVFFQFVDRNEPVYLDLCFSATKDLQFSVYSSYTSLVQHVFQSILFFSMLL